MRGLRSYRAECTIDFQERGLVAVVGDTGAGKSSILEAITYALYNATTWDQRAVGQLISDGLQSMSVELEFQVGDDVWSVLRACHRAPSRPSTHRLRCLSDRSIADCDGETAVNRQVERLLGMSYRAYLAAVVLPQGRFQTLLQETPAKRTAILEGIFRLTDLRAVQKAARELGDRTGAVVRDLTTRREVLLADPAGALEALGGEAEALRQRESVLVELQAAAGATREAVGRAGRRAEVLRERLRLVVAADDGVGERLGRLLPVAAALGAAAAAAGAAEEEAARRVEAAAAASEVGESVEDLAQAAELLRSVRRTLAELETAGEAATAERAAVEAAAAALAGDESALPGLESAAAAAGGAARDAAVALERQRELGRRAREAAAVRDATADEKWRQRAEVPALEERLAECRGSAAGAAAALEARRAELDDAQRHDAAAHAAEGLGRGDLCPVCGRVLEDGFQAPAASALGPLKRAVKEAEAELDACRTAETTAANALAEAGRRLAEVGERLQAAERAALDRLEELRSVAPAASLESIEEHIRELEASAERLAADAASAREGVLNARADASSRRGELERRLSQLEREEARIGDRRSWCAEQLRTIPGAAADVEEAIAAAERRLDEARERRVELEGLREEVARLARERSKLRDRLRDEVERPRGAAMQAAAMLRLRVDDALRELDQPPVEAPPGEADLDAEARWARELEARAADVRRRLDEAIAGAERAGAEAGAALTARLAASELADTEALDAAARQVGRELGRVQSEMRRAEEQIPQAADLDAWIADGTEVRESLSELARLMQDAQFVGHVIERRQRQLLIVASQILGSMTGNAYGFAADFEIVDRATAQPRPTRTLSGGETFLASLALALALVEIAGRSGTQLDALFLDEGFGSLDANALDEALSALELQASGGRLVAVVSHVRAVAERIDTVLEVTRTAAGSRADWRGGTEREVMLTAELESRLLA